MEHPVTLGRPQKAGENAVADDSRRVPRNAAVFMVADYDVKRIWGGLVTDVK